MSLFEKIREISARRALHRKLHAEMAALSESELNELNLSYAKVVELSRQQAYAH